MTDRDVYLKLAAVAEEAGTLLDVATLRNDGILSVAATNVASASHVTGNLVQGTTGVLALDRARARR